MLTASQPDFHAGEILIREGKGDKDRHTMLPEGVTAALRKHLERVKHIHARDLRDGSGRVPLPYALERNDILQRSGIRQEATARLNAGPILLVPTLLSLYTPDCRDWLST